MANPTSPEPLAAVETDLASAPTNGIEARRARQRLEARRAILDASRELLAGSQDGDFSMRALADRLRITCPADPIRFGRLIAALDGALEEVPS